MNVLCPAVRVTLDALGDTGLAGPLETHGAGCESCAAEIAAYRALSTELALLRFDEFHVRARFAERVMESLGPVAVPDPEPKHSKVVPIAVATAAVATAAAGTAVLLHFRRARAA